MFQESVAAIFDEVGHQLKAISTAVVGIGYFALFMLRTELAERSDLGTVVAIAGHRENFLPIEVVHGDDEIELIEVDLDDLTRGARNWDASLLQGFAHAAIRGISGMGVDGAGGVAVDLIRQGAFAEEMPEDILTGRRTADVAPADKENAESGLG